MVRRKPSSSRDVIGCCSIHSSLTRLFGSAGGGAGARRRGAHAKAAVWYRLLKKVSSYRVHRSRTNLGLGFLPWAALDGRLDGSALCCWVQVRLLRFWLLPFLVIAVFRQRRVGVNYF